MSDPDLLAPSVDPNKSALGIRTSKRAFGVPVNVEATE